MHVSLDETIVIYMVGCLYVELAMYDGTMHGTWYGWMELCMYDEVMCWISYMFAL